MINIANYTSPIGNIVLAQKDEKLIGLWMEKQKYFLSTIKEQVEINEDMQIFIDTKNWLDKYFNNQKPNIADIPFLLSGSEFRKEVWKILCDIPYGNTITYKDIAEEISKKKSVKNMSAQAVGGAVGHNPISIIIPCHRVIGKNGSLTGYAGGISKKIWLLTHEGVEEKKYFIPKKGTAL